MNIENGSGGNRGKKHGVKSARIMNECDFHFGLFSYCFSEVIKLFANSHSSFKIVKKWPLQL